MDWLPFTRPHIDEETIAEVVSVLRSGWLTGGPKVSEFEAALSACCGGRSVVACNSGTAALSMALRLLGVGAGDEVITTPLSWVATANVIVELGARPVFVDVDPLTRNIDLSKIPASITGATRVLMPVDLAGVPVNREPLALLASTYGLSIIEDAAQSFGAGEGASRVGLGENFVAFSFHANKNLTTGEGGALVLPSGVSRPVAEQWRLQGVVRPASDEMEVAFPGMKANLTDIAAAIGLGQLRQLDRITSLRRQLAACYFDSLRTDLGLELPVNHGESNWHMFQVLLPKNTVRKTFMASMREQGIGVGVHYPAIHLFSLYRTFGYGVGDFPVAEDIAARTVTLPLFATMTERDVIRVCRACERALLHAPSG